MPTQQSKTMSALEQQALVRAASGFGYNCMNAPEPRVQRGDESWDARGSGCTFRPMSTQKLSDEQRRYLMAFR